MRVFFSGIDKKYLKSSLSFDIPIDCMIKVSIVRGENTIKVIEFYSMHKKSIDFIMDEIYKEVFDYLCIKYYVL